MGLLDWFITEPLPSSHVLRTKARHKQRPVAHVALVEQNFDFLCSLLCDHTKRNALVFVQWVASGPWSLPGWVSNRTDLGLSRVYRNEMIFANYFAMLAYRAGERHQSDTMPKHKFEDWRVIQHSHLNANSNPCLSSIYTHSPGRLWAYQLIEAVTYVALYHREEWDLLWSQLEFAAGALSVAGPKPTQLSSSSFFLNRPARKPCRIDR